MIKSYFFSGFDDGLDFLLVKGKICRNMLQSKIVNKNIEQMFCGLLPVDNVDKLVHNPKNKGLEHVEFFSRQIPHYFCG